MAYIPPALRKKQDDKSVEVTTKWRRASAHDNDNDDGLVSEKEINRHFWPEDVLTDRISSKPPAVNGTLHDSAETPGKLAYVILYNGANPKWASDGLIYTKTDIDILPSKRVNASPTAGSPKTANNDSAEHTTGLEDGNVAIEPHAPIAVFEQSRVKESSRGYRFNGWYSITHLAYLEPHSPELARMLEQKWTRKDRYGKAREVHRDGQRWQQSLGHRWAVVKLERDEGAERENGKLVVAKLPDDELVGPDVAPSKGVNELLREMRLGSGDDGKSPDGGDHDPTIVHKDSGDENK